jgi:hypothetical protein
VSRYWASAIPIYLMVLIVYVVLVYNAMNLIQNAPFESYHTIRGGPSHTISFSSSTFLLLPLAFDLQRFTASHPGTAQTCRSARRMRRSFLRCQSLTRDRISRLPSAS